MKRVIRSMIALTGMACAAQAQSTYDFIDIGLPPGMTNVEVTDIDDAGRVLVYSVTTTPAPWGTRSFLWESGVFTQIGPYQTYARNEAEEIAPDGTIAGTSWLQAGTWPTTAIAWTWKNGVFTTLPSIGYNATNALAINTSGVCTGWGQPPNPFLAFGQVIASTPGSTSVIQNILHVGGSGGRSINDAGLIAAYIPSELALSWQSAAVTCPEGGLHELASAGGMGGLMVSPTAMNNSGQVVGWSLVGNDPITGEAGRAYLWQEGVAISLGTLPGHVGSVALDINDAGLIVGRSGPSGDRHAVKWENGTLIDLETKFTAPGGWNVLWANRVNNAGWIAGEGTVASTNRVYVLKPKP